MNTIGTVYFVFCSLVALLGAVGVVAFRSPIRAAVGLLATVLGVAGLYLKLHAELLAAIQIIVYAGAVVVLFVFVIMLVGPTVGSPSPGRSGVTRALGGGLAAGLGVAAIALLALGAGLPAAFGPVPAAFGSVESVGRQLFTRTLVPFELATALLVVAVVGAVAISRGRDRAPRRDASPANPTRRLFGGPIHPRDLGRPLPDEETP